MQPKTKEERVRLIIRETILDQAFKFKENTINSLVDTIYENLAVHSCLRGIEGDGELADDTNFEVSPY